MLNPRLAAISVAGLSLLGVGALAADATTAAAVRDKIAARLAVEPQDIRPSPVPGLLEVVSGTEIGYVSEDGRFYIDGDVFDMESRANLTDVRRQAGRVALLRPVRDEDAVVFSPKGVKYTINVFTDVDCAYCRKLHTEIDELNRLGVKVRYLMFPRNGPGTPAWKQAEAVWCSADRRDALTRAKRGEQIKAAECATPVSRQYELGREVGIRGTPGIITEQGEYIPGYLPAAQLVERLKGAGNKGS